LNQQLRYRITSSTGIYVTYLWLNLSQSYQTDRADLSLTMRQ